jgi:hypothetical protein
MQPDLHHVSAATPERSDGGDLLALCQQNLVYRCDLVDGAARRRGAEAGRRHRQELLEATQYRAWP